MDKLAIFGGSGFLGRHLLNNSYWQNNNANIFLRDTDSLNNLSNLSSTLNLIKADLTDLYNSKTILSETTHVVYCARLSNPADDILALKNLLSHLNLKKIKIFIFISTALVAGQNKTIVTESTECEAKTDYQKQKLEIENILISQKELFGKLTILRPTAIFGNGGQNLNSLIDSILHGNKFLNYMKACIMGKRTMNLVPVDRVVDIIILILKSRITNFNKIIISCDQNKLNNYNDISKLVNKTLNRKQLFPTIPFPPFIYENLYRIIKGESIKISIKYLSQEIENDVEDFEEKIVTYTKQRASSK